MGLRILQFGRTGQVGLELLLRAARRGHNVAALGRDTVDMVQPQRVKQAVALAGAVDIVVNGAAYTAVDKAESEPAIAAAVNAESVAMLAETCRERGIPLIHLSTDYVFDGTKNGPYVEDDPVNPLNAYGRSKLAGENAVRAILDAHVIVRTSWIYSAHGTNFVKTMLRLGAERDALGIVDDQVGAPTPAGDIAEACLAIAEAVSAPGGGGRWGTYHFSASGETSWCGFAEAIFASAGGWAGIKAKVSPIASSQYPTAARRPANSRLDCTKIGAAFGIRSRPWQDGLAEVLDELKRERTTSQ